jgi:hypothetical protein
MRVVFTLLTLTTLMLIGCAGSDRSAKDEGKSPDKKGTDTQPKGGEDLAKAPADFSLGSEEFVKEFLKDRKTADAKYVGKVVELSAVVDFVGKNIGDEPYVRLPGEKFDTAMCFTADKEPWAKVLPGQKVKLKGKCAEYIVAVRMLHCVFTETGPYPAIARTADELAKEFEADSNKADEKYREKYLVVTGEVADKKDEDKTGARIYFKTSGKARVECDFRFAISNQLKDFLSSVKTGQQFKAVGRYSFGSSDKVQVDECNQIKLP